MKKCSILAWQKFVSKICPQSAYIRTWASQTPKVREHRPHFSDSAHFGTFLRDIIKDDQSQRTPLLKMRIQIKNVTNFRHSYLRCDRWAELFKTEGRGCFCEVADELFVLVALLALALLTADEEATEVALVEVSEAALLFLCKRFWPLMLLRTLPPALALRIWPRRTGGRIADGNRWYPAGKTSISTMASVSETARVSIGSRDTSTLRQSSEAERRLISAGFGSSGPPSLSPPDDKLSIELERMRSAWSWAAGFTILDSSSGSRLEADMIDDVLEIQSAKGNEDVKIP